MMKYYLHLLLIRYYKKGWPKYLVKNIKGEIKHYCNNRLDITVQDSLFYFTNKLIILTNLRKTILQLLIHQ